MNRYGKLSPTLGFIYVTVFHMRENRSDRSTHRICSLIPITNHKSSHHDAYGQIPESLSLEALSRDAYSDSFTDSRSDA